jgi:Uma2 family endonuclease
MGLALEEQKYFTVEEYLEYEEHSEFRHEFYQGELFAMAGGTTNHNRLVNRGRSIAERTFLPRGCDVFSETVKLEVIKNEYYPYPDVMITCNRMDLSAKYIIKFPSLIIEVLSHSTESRDRGWKFARYKKIPTLKYYVLVSQTSVYVEVFTRIEGIDIWKYQSYDTIEAVIDFDEIDFKLPISEMYQNIVFEEDENKNPSPEE